uniref:Uncharacterized protein n=1 Tax=Rhizophora mucronata TaxID=61149 RepID=A0A2P2QQ02_RHIMU
MSERNLETLVPDRVLGVWDDTRASHRGPSYTDRHVRVARDDLAVVVRALASFGERLATLVKGGEASSKSLR